MLKGKIRDFEKLVIVYIEGKLHVVVLKINIDCGELGNLLTGKCTFFP